MLGLEDDPPLELFREKVLLPNQIFVTVCPCVTGPKAADMCTCGHGQDGGHRSMRHLIRANNGINVSPTGRVSCDGHRGPLPPNPHSPTRVPTPHSPLPTPHSPLPGF